MTALRRILCLPIALLGLGACASSGSTATTTHTSTASVGGSGVGRIALTTVNESDVITIQQDADAVFKVLASAYDSLGIPVNTVDPKARTVGNNGLKIRNRLGKMPLSMYLDCGNTQIGPNADTYDVYMTIMSTVTSGGTGVAKLSTLIEAQARPATYNQAYNACSTKSALEQKLADVINRRLGK